MPRPGLSSTAQAIVWHARNTPDAAAIVVQQSRITYRAMASDLACCRLQVKRWGIQPGMIVGIDTPFRYLHLLLSLACEVVGAAATSLSPGECVADDPVFPHCDVVFVTRSAATSLAPRMIVIPDDWPAGLAMVSPAATDGCVLDLLDRDIPADQVVRIVRTSGTTGRPKAMPIQNGIQQLRISRTIGRVAHDILPTPRFLCLYQLALNSVYIRVLGILQNGGSVVFAFDEHARDHIATGLVNYAHLAVGDCERIIHNAGPPPPGHRFHLEVFGAAASGRLRQLVRQRLNARITNKYSSNETNPVAIVDDDNVGTLCEGVQVRIVDEAGRDKPAGETGLIRIKSDTMVSGYFNDPAMTAAAFIDGWFQTRDIGMVPEPGRLVVLGRTDDMLNIGGVKMSRLPIEAAVRRLVGVSDAAAMSVANVNGIGTLLVAVEVGADRCPDELGHQIATVMFGFSRTFQILPMTRFPRSPSGKIRRGEIEAAFRRRTDPAQTAAGGTARSED